MSTQEGDKHKAQLHLDLSIRHLRRALYELEAMQNHDKPTTDINAFAAAAHLSAGAVHVKFVEELADHPEARR